jgi:hypothetical protein
MGGLPIDETRHSTRLNEGVAGMRITMDQVEELGVLRGKVFFSLPQRSGIDLV